MSSSKLLLARAVGVDVPDLTIEVTGDLQPPALDADDPPLYERTRAFYCYQGRELVAAIRGSLPGGTMDGLLLALLEDRAGVLRVPLGDTPRDRNTAEEVPCARVPPGRTHSTCADCFEAGRTEERRARSVHMTAIGDHPREARWLVEIVDRPEEKENLLSEVDVVALVSRDLEAGVTIGTVRRFFPESPAREAPDFDGGWEHDGDCSCSWCCGYRAGCDE